MHDTELSQHEVLKYLLELMEVSTGYLCDNINHSDPAIHSALAKIQLLLSLTRLFMVDASFKYRPAPDSKASSQPPDERPF